MSEDIKVKSLAKAMNVLECFSLEKPELSIKEISETLCIPKSSAHNIADTFVKLGYLGQHKETSKYYLGRGLLKFSYIINNHLGFRNFFLPFMEKISNYTNEVVFLGIPYEQKVLYLENNFPRGSMATRNILGERADMYCTGLGKVMLAFMPLEDQERYADRVYKKYTERTITNKKDLLKELQLIQQRGYAIDNMEHEHGVTCVAIPIFGIDGSLIAAISTSAPSLRIDAIGIDNIARTMIEILKPAQKAL